MSARKLEIPAVVLVVATIAALHGWAVVVLTPTHPGLIGLNLNALGTDWMPFYGGVRWLFEGHLGALFDGGRLTAYLNSTLAGWLSQPLSFRPWVYPPTYLFVVLPFGMLPFVASYFAFQFATAALLAAALWFGTDGRNARVLVTAAALLGPAAAINVGLGQNAFLTAALLVGGFRMLRTRPALGGAILGVLIVKPQNWLLVPLALAAGREWKALVWSIFVATGLTLASVGFFGLDSWRHWFDLVQVGYERVNLGGVWDDSIYACLVSGGAPPGLANAAQAAGIMLGAGLVYWAFRLRLSSDQKIAVLLASTILAAPHSALADTELLAIAAVLWISEAAQDGASLATWTLALALWLTPLFNPPLVSPVGRLTPLLILGFIAMTIAAAGRPLGLRREAAPSAPGGLAAEE